MEKNQLNKWNFFVDVALWPFLFIHQILFFVFYCRQRTNVERSNSAFTLSINSMSCNPTIDMLKRNLHILTRTILKIFRRASLIKQRYDIHSSNGWICDEEVEWFRTLNARTYIFNNRHNNNSQSIMFLYGQ
jgi:hypothetical protein